MASVFLALLLVIVAIVFEYPKIVREQLGRAVHGIQALLILLAVLSLASTSFVRIGSNEVGLLSRIYLAQQLPPGHIIAMGNEKGPQAEILSPGFHFHFLLN